MDQRKPTFDSVRPDINFPRDEGAILEFWKQRSIFQKTLEANEASPQGTFVFYEGPPTANGVPHNGHVLTRVIKDLFPRFKTMRGFNVPRKAGWDTHGLPVEVEVSKELRIPDKAGIEAYGIEPFTQKCIESVFRYTTEWERITEKIGFWVDLPKAYVTFHRSYVESVWWALSNLFDKGLLYQGHKVVWWWAQGGTALSSHEVGQGWKTVDDPSVIVRLRLRDDPKTSILVWTTTPWTLPSNVYAAVDPKVDYAVVADDDDRKMIVASALVPTLEKQLKKKLEVLETRKGADLIGLCYVPPFDIYFSKHADLMAKLQTGGEVRAFWRVVEAEFVTLDTGTGVVHIAPAFGEDDFSLHRKLVATYSNAEHIPLLCAIKPDGKFVAEMGEQYAGRWVKEADKDLTRELEQKKLLVHSEPYRHDYPFCWRSDADPLIQMARPAWYIRTTERIQNAITNNQKVFWQPDHIKDGRFGDFLANNVDWALSRERYWGTPLNVWLCSANPEHKHAPDSVASILKLNPRAFERFDEARDSDPGLSEHLMVHKPWIDYVTFPCPQCGAEMRRVPEVIDCWFDSGCMPFAQWGYPHADGSREAFDQAFPADFISEAIDQTRGWFYSLLMISTLVFDEETQAKMGLSKARPYPHPYKTCIVLGHTCDKDGKKESKSKGNYTPPEVILDSVQMEFAVVDDSQGKVASADGTALIATDDLEGLDLTDGTRVNVFRAEQPDKALTVTIKDTRKLPRRVVLLSEKDRAQLGAEVCPMGTSVMPVEVPRLPAGQRLMIQDPTTPAPGADAFRWFFYSTSPPWTNTRHSLSNVRAAQKDFQIKLRNVYSFFTIYANIDGFNPAVGLADLKGLDAEALSHCEGYRPVKERALLDRWILSEIALATREVTDHLEGYRVYEASLRLIEVVDALSNWYVRRSRERFWASGFSQDKRDAYHTLYTTLVTLARLAAPFIPFFAEEMYQNLVRRVWRKSQPESVHLCTWPKVDEAAIDEALSVEMKAVRELVSLGLQVRTNNRLKVRQPLGRADVVLARQELSSRLVSHADLIASELNVHEVRWLKPGEEGEEVRYKVKPNFRSLGPKIGKQVQAAKKALESADPGRLRAALVTEGKVSLQLEGMSLELAPEDVEVAVEAAEGFAAAGDKVGVVVIHTTLTEELIDEGFERECLSRIQAVRKDMNLDYTARIKVAVDGSERIKKVCTAASARISKEVLASELVIGPADFEPAIVKEGDLDGERFTLSILPV
ncbi:MAG: isoleucine--tRNA ligase [Deltaproteobacteria bacterium]|nr:isoleucine--tRNA ligase [Deltaproteobacteria bacterium]